MSPLLRARVVEFLRCAADVRPNGIGINGMFQASADLAAGPLTEQVAWDALTSVTELKLYPRDAVGWIDHAYQCELLDAAQLVEDGVYR